MARTTGLGPSSPYSSTGAYGDTASGAYGGPKAPGLRLGKMSLGGVGGGLSPGGALFLLVLLEAGVQVLFRSYFRRAHGG